MVPEIETARLRLRAPKASDLDEHAAMLADPVVVRHLGGAPHAREEAWRKMLAATACWTMLGYGYWAVERKEDGRYIGLIGFADFKRDLTPSIEGLPELGWILGSHAHGHGYASEAVEAALRWADETLEGEEIVAIIDHANAGSIRVAEKARFTVREEAQYRTAPILLFRRTRSA
jgi:RimJ/RimL family protein N-acetyltransferase